jgi:transcription initiation factor TFIIIB Brf1 subunit/transcription initiation factor TFIIB
MNIAINYEGDIFADFGISDPNSDEHQILAASSNSLSNPIGSVANKIIAPDIYITKTIYNLDVALINEPEPPKQEICPECNIQLKLLDDVLICEKCGLEQDYNAEYNAEMYNVAVDGNYNSSTTSSTSFTFSGGKKSYGYQKAMLRTCSEYSITSYQTIKKEILNRINMYNGNKPPMNVQLACIDMYYSLKENDKSYLEAINKGQTEQNEKKRLVFRSNGKWGIIAACLYYTCIAEGLTRTPREISEIIGIDEKYQSIGDKRLQEFNELGIINIPIHNKLLENYIYRYFPLLSIPEKYKDFVCDIIKRADDKGLHICIDIRTSTKCVGVIYLLTTRVPELMHISKDTITKECRISKTSYMRYASIISNNFIVIKKIFKLYQIPMPIEWKNM